MFAGWRGSKGPAASFMVGAGAGSLGVAGSLSRASGARGVMRGDRRRGEVV